MSSLPLTPPITPKFPGGFTSPPPFIFEQNLLAKVNSQLDREEVSSETEACSSLHLDKEPCIWFPLIRFMEYPERFLGKRPTIGPLFARSIWDCTSFDDYAAQLQVPVFSQQWASLQGFSATLPAFHTIGTSNQDFGKVLPDSLLTTAVQQKIDNELHKQEHWNIVVLHQKDHVDHIFAGFAQYEDCPRTILDIYHAVHILMDKLWRPVDWWLVRSNGSVLDYRQDGDHAAPSGILRLCLSDGSPLQDVRFDVKEYPLPPRYNWRPKAQGSELCQLPEDAPEPAAGNGMVLSATRRTNSNLMASAAVRARDMNKCFMSGKSIEGFQDYRPAKLSVAHILPASNEELIWKHRYSFDPKGIMWQGPYVNTKKLDPAQAHYFYPTLALLPHHPANNMLLIQEQHDHFDNFYSYICPWTKRIVHAVPLPQTCVKVMEDAKHGQLAAGSFEYRSGELATPSIPALFHQASQVINVWNRLWFETAAIENGALMTRLGELEECNQLSQTASVEKSLPPLKVNRPRQSLPSRPKQPPRAARTRSLSVSSIDSTPANFRGSTTLLLPLLLESPPTLPFKTCQDVWSSLESRHPLRLSPPWPEPQVSSSSLASPLDQDDGHARLWHGIDEKEIRSRDMDWESPELIKRQQVEIGSAPLSPLDLKAVFALLRPLAKEEEASEIKYLEDEEDDQDDDFLEDWQREENFPPDEMYGIPWVELGEDLHAILEHEMRMAQQLRKPRW